MRTLAIVSRTFTRFSRLTAYAVFATGLASPLAMADDVSRQLAEPADIAISPRLNAKVMQPDATHLSVRLNNGMTQRLPITPDMGEGSQSLESADYNFDGYLDMALVTNVGMVNQAYQIFLFNPADTLFEPLQVNISKNTPGSTCGGLFGIEANAAERTLKSSCRSGPAWYAEAYRYGPDNNLYLSQTEKMLPDRLLMLADSEISGAPIWRVITLDSNGKTIAQHITDVGGDEAFLKVKKERLALHEQPRADPTHRYLIKGDRVQVTNLSADQQWLEVSFTTPKKRVITGWIALADITPLAQAQ